MCKGRVSVDRIGQIMKAEEERSRGKTPPTDREIRFEHVSIGYEGVPETLHDIGMKIRDHQQSFCFR